ncbi:MAG: hypothetical protein IR164_06140 [Devosia sp.]|nr:hypothetical protein [Devosia sp.]MBF0678498.1 hypothetical protein [Devosia sp.]
MDKDLDRRETPKTPRGASDNQMKHADARQKACHQRIADKAERSPIAFNLEVARHAWQQSLVGRDLHQPDE